MWNTLKLEGLLFNWFDLVLILFLLVGFAYGRKHGLSQVLMSLLQWLAIVLGAALSYEPVGNWLATKGIFSTLTCYITAYVAAVIVIKSLFTLLKRLFGGKLMGSDVFGSAEYYLGMVAGMAQFACILVCLLALLNARYYSPEEVKQRQKNQQELYGKTFFPGLDTIQRYVFVRSFTGPYIQKSFLLIKPTPPEIKQLRRKEIDMF
jgi:uncharacterized membrane protein required for colicin V production